MSVDDAKHLTLFVARLVRVSIDGGYGGLCYAHLHTYSDRCLISFLCARCTVHSVVFIIPLHYRYFFPSPFYILRPRTLLGTRID